MKELELLHMYKHKCCKTSNIFNTTLTMQMIKQESYIQHNIKARPTLRFIVHFNPQYISNYTFPKIGIPNGQLGSPGVKSLDVRLRMMHIVDRQPDGKAIIVFKHSHDDTARLEGLRAESTVEYPAEVDFPNLQLG